MPYNTRLTKFLPTISFESSSTPKVEVVEPDSTWTWSTKDSINFANSIEFIVTPPNSQAIPRRYSFKLNVHKIDPDTIEWKKVSEFTKSDGDLIKAIVNEDDLFVYIKTTSGITLHKSNKNTISWTSATIAGVAPSSVKLESLTFFNNNLYLVDNAGMVYSSSVSDGINWTSTGNTTPVYSILGILPESVAANDSLLVLVENGANYSFAKSFDMATIKTVSKIKGYSANIAEKAFPATLFSSSTKYDRANASQNLLFVSGGITFKGDQSMTTWLISKGRNNVLEVSPTNDTGKQTLLVDDDFTTTLYDDQMYGFTNDSIYISKLGYDWAKAPDKQAFDSSMRTNKGQSTFVDKDNFIWVIGDMGRPKYEIWKGQLNRLRK